MSVGVAMDAAAVSAARGLAVGRVRPSHVLLVASFFGGFQALMPALGFLLGREVGELVRAFDHWIVFVVLSVIGARMVLESRRPAGVPASSEDLFAPGVMLALAVATSVDALAVGMTLPLLAAPLVLSVVTMGVTTAVLSALALVAGSRLGARLGPRLDVLGGVILIAAGARILVEHLARG